MPMSCPAPALPVFHAGDRVSYMGELATVVHGNEPDPTWQPNNGPLCSTINIRLERNVSRRMSQQQDVYATSVLPA